MNNISIGSFFKICALFVISRLLILISFALALSKYASYDVKNGNFQYYANKLLNCFGCWDSGWYLNIIANGYVYNPDLTAQTNYGFFPFYPMAVKFMSLLFQDKFISAIIVSNLFLLLASFFLYLLCIKIYGSKKIGIIAIAVMCFFPGSYLLSGVFSESAFLCFSIMCVYYFEEENYFFCGISGFILSLTRPFGVLILLPLFCAYILKNGLKFKMELLYLMLIPFGMFSFFSYCYFTTGDFLHYVHAKRVGWETHSSKPWKVLNSGLRVKDNLYIKINSYYTLFWLLMPVFITRHLRIYLLLWVLLLIITPLSNGFVNLICMPRYIVVCFPLFMMVGSLIEKNRWVWVFMALLAVINLILSGFFALGYQFAA